MQKDYWIRKRKKRGFVVTWRDRQKRVTGTLKNASLDEINRQFRAKAITEQIAESLVRDLITKLKPQKEYFHKENQLFLDHYWEAVYSTKDLKSTQSAYDRLSRALRALGDLSIHVSDKHQIQKKIKDHPQQRAVATVLNQFMKFLGRPIRLDYNKARRPKIRHLEWRDFQKAMCFVEDPHLKLLYTILFCSGCRPGEAFAISALPPEKRPVVFVATQIKRNREEDETKTGQERPVPLILDGWKSLKQWLEIPQADRMALRNSRGELLKDACRRAGVQETTLKDLRHSYAIHLGNLGFNKGTIARCLGNSEAVCERYYAGFILTDSGVDFVLNQLKEVSAQA